MDKQILKVPAEISRVQTMADGGLRLFVDTQEVGPEDKGLIMGLHKKLGWFLFAESEVNQEDALDLPDIKFEKDEKTPSQRLRAVLYLLWEKQGKKGTSEEFYRKYLEKVIESLKEKLN